MYIYIIANTSSSVK